MRYRASVARPRTVVFVTGLVVLACGEPLGLADLDRLELVEGNGQIATVATAVPVPPAVRAVTIEDEPIAGLDVRFEVTEGGGTVTGATTTTDDQGVAAVGSWVLGETAGPNTLRAVVAGGQTTFEFNAVGLVGAPATVEKIEGDNQTFTAGRALPVRARVRVLDAFANPIERAVVSFRIGADGPGGSVDTLAVATDAEGLARARPWTLDPNPGPNSLVATADTARATFRATGVSGPVTLTVAAGDSQTTTVDTPVPVSPQILVSDALGLPVPGVPVAFRAAVGGGAVSMDTVLTDAQGLATVDWTLGTAAGLNRLVAEADGLLGPLLTAFATADAPANIVAVMGDDQFGEIGKSVPLAPTVRLADRFDNPVIGEMVSFTVTAGGGSVSDTLVASDSLGLARTRQWLMGPGTGTNTLDASVPGIPPATFTATALTAVYDIQMVRQGGGGPVFAAAINDAVARWRSVVVGDLPDVDFSADPLPANTCVNGQDEINGTIDDLRIYAFVEDIDGPGGVLGSAGPCVARDSSQLTVVGVMRFDREDVTRLSQSAVTDIVLHEIGHVLGIGTIWDTLGLLVNPSLPPGSDGADTHFPGPRAIAAFDSLGGAGFSQSKVPVENSQGDRGTQDAHWRETTLRDELMTGFLNSNGNPLSLITIESLGDLGYDVNGAPADDFSVPFAVVEADRGGPARSLIPLPHDIRRGPIYFVGRNGRVTGVFRP